MLLLHASLVNERIFGKASPLYTHQLDMLTFH